MERSGAREHSKATKLPKNKKKRCEVNKTTFYFLDIIIKSSFFFVSDFSGCEKGRYSINL